jgi:23S rRNA (uracil1939-C5)-methyltransferase
VREKSIAAAPGIPGIDFLISPDAFFQTNVGAARALVALVVDGVGAAKRVLDLYSGSGLFALPLAAKGAQVTAIEENRRAIEDLQANAALNRVPHARIKWMAARVEEALVRLDRQSWDAVVLDPPYDGCTPGVLASIFDRIKPARVVYVSCNPDALARELPDILNCGYRVERLQAVDMFPHTEHLEVVVTLADAAGPGVRPSKSRTRREMT